MDGYTVEEAATVLGVPRERVWELVARGVISGSADLGGSMRVRLKAEPAPEQHPDRAGEAATQTVETSPFRELLTEFRSLTERYGQALLALGEARGEVAGLRSRVEGLEARFDLRLSSGPAPPASSGWAAAPWPTPNERVIETPLEVRRAPAATEPSSASPAAGVDEDGHGALAEHAEEAGSRKRARTGRHATERFADALARAEDPSRPELPGATETAAALAALRRESAREGAESSEADLDASLPRELPAADTVPVADEAEAAPPEAADAPAESAPQTDGPGVSAAEAAPSEDASSLPQPVGPEPTAETASPAAREPAWDPERYSATIEQPEWMVVDDAAAAEPEPAGPEPDAVPATSEPEPVTATPVPPPAPASTESSGSRELDEALAALDALVHPVPEATVAERPTSVDGLPGNQSASPPAQTHVAVPVAQPSRDEWRPAFTPPVPTRSPASRAYRRLRRIFPA